MAMASKHRLTPSDDIELRVVVKFRVVSNFQGRKLIQNTPADHVHGAELEINLLGVSLLL